MCWLSEQVISFFSHLNVIELYFRFGLFPPRVKVLDVSPGGKGNHAYDTFRQRFENCKFGLSVIYGHGDHDCLFMTSSCDLIL